jgi:UDPglucose--hexose-1-phosphate uridylyltransferase
VPAWVRNAMRVQQQYFDQHGICTLCAMLEYELQDGSRVIEESADYAVLSPYAPSAPYETWVVPKRHFACYSEVQDSDISHISAGVRTVLNAYVNKLNNPDFNYYLHSSPFPMAKVPFYHFFVRIVPRLWNNGGFETGTGMSVISTMPEDAAAFLKGDSTV